MPKDDWVYIGHILDLCHQAKEIIAGKQRKNYDQEIVFKLALTYLIRVISEAAQQVSRDFQEKYPQVSWREIIGMRHRIVHDYLNVNEDVVWGMGNRVPRSFDARIAEWSESPEPFGESRDHATLPWF